MRSFLKRHKIIAIVLLLVLGITLFFIFRPEPSPAPQPAPTPVPFVLEQISPTEGKQEIVIPDLAISFLFSSAVDKSSIVVNINPLTDYEISTDKTDKTIYLKPVPSWKFNSVYNIKLSVKSKDGRGLPPINYSFEPLRVTSSDLEEMSI